MADSIRDLKAILDAKGGDLPTLTSDDLQSLRNYIIGMVNDRAEGLPADSEASRSGTDCTNLTGGSPPSSPLSVGDLDSWQGTTGNLPSCTCDAQTYVQSWCSSRTTCDCNDRLACECNGRTSVICGSRNACYCNNHDPGGGVGCGNNQGCNCHARYTACPCRNRSWCQSRTACDCNARTDYLCTDRTIDILSATCACDTRCSCNTVDVFG